MLGGVREPLEAGGSAAWGVCELEGDEGVVDVPQMCGLRLALSSSRGCFLTTLFACLVERFGRSVLRIEIWWFSLAMLIFDACLIRGLPDMVVLFERRPLLFLAYHVFY